MRLEIQGASWNRIIRSLGFPDFAMAFLSIGRCSCLQDVLFSRLELCTFESRTLSYT